MSLLSGRTAQAVEGTAVASGQGTPRLVLGPDSTVCEVDGAGGVEHFDDWDLAAARERLLAHQPGPLDLDVELQEEVVLRHWRLGRRQPERLGERHVYPLRGGGLELAAVVADGAEGEALGKALEGLRWPRRGVKGKRRGSEPPPLYGLLHYELCRLVFQPLSLLDGDWPTHLMLGDNKLGARELLKALDFTG